MTRGCDPLPTLSIRAQAIVRLLETRNDGLPELVRRVDGVSGFVHEARSRACPDCLANGLVMRTCETCFGRGVIDPVYAKNVAAVDAREDDSDRRDPYSVSSETRPYGLDGSRRDHAHARDRQIEALAKQTRPAPTEAELMEEANSRGYGWEEQRRAMHRRFDYAPLDVALDELRAHDYDAYRALHAVYVYKWLTDVDGTAARLCWRGLRFLSPHLAAFELARGRALRAPGVEVRPLNVAARGRGADERALAQRDDEIVRAICEAKMPTAAVAHAWGLSVSQVNRIVAKGARAA